MVNPLQNQTPVPVLQNMTPAPTLQIMTPAPNLNFQNTIPRLTGQPAPIPPIQEAISRQSFDQPQFKPVPLKKKKPLTIGQLEREAQLGKAQSLVEEFQELTPEEAASKAEAGEKGFIGQSIEGGTRTFFNIEEFTPEISAAGTEAVSGAGFGARDVLFPGQKGGIAPVVFDIFRGKGKEGLERAGLRTGEDVILRLKLGEAGAEMTSEFFKEAITGGIFKDKPDTFGFGDDIKLFDTRIPKNIKEEPLSFVGEAEQFRVLGQLVAVGAVTSPMVLGEGIPLSKRISATVGEFHPVRIKPGTYTAPPPSSQSELNKIVADIRGFEFSNEFGKDVAFVGKGRGLINDDLEFLTFGRTFGDDSLNVVRLKQPTLEIGRSGFVREGTIESVEFGLPEATSGKFPSTARLGRIKDRDVLKEFADVSRITDRITKRSSFVGLERDARLLDISKDLFAEDFLFASGKQPGITQFDLADISTGLRTSPKTSQGILISDATKFDASIFGRFRLVQPRLEETVGTRVVGIKRPKKPKTINLQVTQDQQIKSLLGGVESATQKALAKQAFQVSSAIKPPKIKLDTLPGSGVFGVLKQQPSQFAGTGLFEKTNFETFRIKKPSTGTGELGGIQTDFVGGKGSFGGAFTPLELPRDSQDFVNKGFGSVKILGGSIQDTPGGSRLFGGLLQGTPPLSVPRQPSIQLTGLLTGSGQDTPFRSITEQVTTPPPVIGFHPFRSPPPPRGGLFGFPPPLPGLFDFPKRRAKGKRKLKRQTSLISLPSQLGIELTGFSLEQERTGLVPRGLVAPKRKKKRRSQADLLF